MLSFPQQIQTMFSRYTQNIFQVIFLQGREKKEYEIWKYKIFYYSIFEIQRPAENIKHFL